MTRQQNVCRKYPKYSNTSSPYNTCSKFNAKLHNAISSASNCRSRDSKFESQLDHIASVEIDHEKVFMDILPFRRVKDVMSVIGVSMRRSTSNRLED